MPALSPLFPISDVPSHQNACFAWHFPLVSVFYHGCLWFSPLLGMCWESFFAVELTAFSSILTLLLIFDCSLTARDFPGLCFIRGALLFLLSQLPLFIGSKFFVFWLRVLMHGPSLILLLHGFLFNACVLLLKPWPFSILKNNSPQLICVASHVKYSFLWDVSPAGPISGITVYAFPSLPIEDTRLSYLSSVKPKGKKASLLSPHIQFWYTQILRVLHFHSPKF